MLAHPRSGHPCKVDAADRHAPFARRIELAQHQKQTALAGAGSAEDAEAAPRRDRERHIVQHVRTRLIAERHMVEHDVPVHRGLLCVRRVLLDRRIQNFADTRNRNARLAHLRDDAAKPPHRPDDHGIVDGERHKVALGHLAAHAEQTADHHDQHCLDAGRRIANRPEIRQRLAQAHPERRIFLILLFKPLTLKIFAAKRTHHAHAGQVLLRDRREHALALVAGREPVADAVVEQHRIAHDDREHQPRYERQFPVHQRHTRQRQHDHRDHAEHRDELLLKELLDALHVRRAALDDVAGRIFRVPRPRQVLNVPIEQITARLDECFARLCAVEIRQKAEHCREQTDAHQHRGRNPECTTNMLRPAERRNDPFRRPDMHRCVPDERVYAHADDLRDEQLAARKHQARHDADQKIAPASMQKPEQCAPITRLLRSLIQALPLAFHQSKLLRQ